MARLVSSKEYRKLVRQPRSKFGNRKTQGYDSRFEARVASELKKYQIAGKITKLKTQEKYPLQLHHPEKGFLPLGRRHVRVDFSFVVGEKTILLDAKGYLDPAQKLKYQIFEFFLPTLYPGYEFVLLYYRPGWDAELSELILTR